MIEFSKITLLYGLFNEFVFSEAKMNYEYLNLYYTSDPYLKVNPLIGKFLGLIKNHKFSDITETTFISLLAEDKRSDDEIKDILNKIKLYKSYTKEQAITFREYLKKICYKAYLDQIKYISEGDPISYVDGIKKFEYKSNHSDSLSIKNFSELDISDLIFRYSAEGYSSRYEFINNSFTCKGYIPGQIVQVVGSPSTGKSLFLQGEAVNFINQGKKVHYLALGDMNELDFAIRMTCMMALKPKWVVESDIYTYYNMYKSQFQEYLGVTIIPSGYVTAGDYVDWIIQRLNEFEILIIDYDSNFKQDPGLSMYDQGGATYDLLTRLTREGKLVFVAAQPKICYFGAEKLPLDAAGESSRKQHISDMIITLGKRSDSTMRMGYMCIVKNRRGDNAEQPWIGTNEGLFYPCSDLLYAKYRNQKSTSRRLYSYHELSEQDILDSTLEDIKT